MCSVAAVVVMIVEYNKKSRRGKKPAAVHSIDKTGTWTWFRFTLLLHNWTKFCCVRFASLKMCLGVFFCKLFASPMFPLYRSVWCVCMYFFGILFCFSSCQTNWTKQNSNEEKVYSFTFCHKLKQIFQFVLETWAISKW